MMKKEKVPIFCFRQAETNDKFYLTGDIISRDPIIKRKRVELGELVDVFAGEERVGDIEYEDGGLITLQDRYANRFIFLINHNEDMNRALEAYNKKEFAEMSR